MTAPRYRTATNSSVRGHTIADRAGLTHSSGAVLSEILERADRRAAGWVAVIGHVALATAVGYSVRTVDRAIRALRDAGLLLVLVPAPWRRRRHRAVSRYALRGDCVAMLGELPPRPRRRRERVPPRPRLLGASIAPGARYSSSCGAIVQAPGALAPVPPATSSSPAITAVSALVADVGMTCQNVGSILEGRSERTGAAPALPRGATPPSPRPASLSLAGQPEAGRSRPAERSASQGSSGSHRAGDASPTNVAPRAPAGRVAAPSPTLPEQPLSGSELEAERRLRLVAARAFASSNRPRTAPSTLPRPKLPPDVDPAKAARLDALLRRFGRSTAHDARRAPDPVPEATTTCVADPNESAQLRLAVRLAWKPPG